MNPPSPNPASEVQRAVERLTEETTQDVYKTYQTEDERNEDITILLASHAALQAERDALAAQLAPSPCGKEGHIARDWVESPYEHACHESCLHGHCLACRREQEEYERGLREGQG